MNLPNLLNQLTKSLKILFITCQKAILIVGIISNYATAQGDLDIAVEILPPYPNRIEYYINNADNAFINLTNISAQDKQIYLHAVILGDNGLMAVTKETYRPSMSLTIPSFQSVFLTGSDLAGTDLGFNDFGNIDISGVTPEYQDLIYIQRILPAGNYQICIIARDWNTGMPVSQGCSSEFTIFDTSSPLIYLPLEGEVIEPNLSSNVQIAWWPPFTGASATPQFKYRLKIIDITDEQFHDLDLEMNNPGRRIILDRDFIQEEFFLFDWTSGGIPLDTGGLYAVRVQAQDMTGQVPVDNNGYSEVVTFRYGEISDTPVEDPATSASDCEGYCEFNLPANQAAVSNISGFDKLKIGFFEVQDLSITQADGNAASGTGRIAIAFLDSVLINVQFTGVKVNANGRIFEGEVAAIADYAYDPLNPASLSAWNQFVRADRMISTLMGGRNRALNLPIGMMYNLSGEHVMLGFTEATFTPIRASCQVMHAMNFPSWGNYWASISASDICIFPSGFGQQFIMHPAVDIPLPDLGGNQFSIKGTLATSDTLVKQQSTYMQVDCQGIKSFGLNLEVIFSRDVLVPDLDDGTPGDGEVTGRILAHFPRAADSPIMGSGENLQFGFIGILDMDPFQIKGLPGVGFTVTKAWADASDTQNPIDMVIPSNYQGPDVVSYNSVVTLEPTWESFYMESLEIRSPEDWLVKGLRLEGTIQNIIIDPLITAKFSLNNIASTNQGNYDFSLDTFYVDLVQWSTHHTGSWEAGLKGTVGIPLTSAEDDFRYSGILLPHDGSDAYDLELLIQTPGGVSFPVMGNAQANLCPNSFIRIAIINNEEILDTHLAGNMSLGITAPISFTIPFVDFHIGYDSQIGITHEAFSILGVAVGEEVSCANIPEAPSIAGTAGHSGTGSSGSGSSGGGAGGSGGGGSASSSSGNGSAGSSTASAGAVGTPTSGAGDPLPPPPGANNTMGMNNFPIELKEIKLKQLSPDRISFDINPSIDILGGGQNGFGAEVDFYVNTDFNSSTKKFELGSNSFQIGRIQLNQVNTFGCSLNGFVDFYNENDAKGARGALSVDLPLGLEIDLEADFGVVMSDPSIEFGTSAQHYGYWYVDGMIGFGSGIPLAPGVNLHGLGGGIYINMDRTGGFQDNASNTLVQQEVNSVLGSLEFDGSTSSTPTTMKPTPKYGTYGLKLASRLATTIPEALNMDVNIAGSFSVNSGINALSINGDAFLMSPMNKREQANFWANAGLHWTKLDKSNHQFNGNIALYANVAGGVLRGAGAGDKVVDVSFEANTATGKWFFKAGEPNDRAGLKVNLVLASLQANGYFMFGHDMPTNLPIPAAVNSILGKTNSNSKDGNRLDNQNALKGTMKRDNANSGFYENGQGIAFGLETSVGFDLRAWALYARLNAFLGFDINLTRLPGATCYVPGSGQIAPGINDWYATGQIYAGFEGAMGLKGRFLGRDYEFELFAMGAAMIIQAGGPNPTWAEGRAGVYYNVLNGVLKGHANFDLSVGDKCIPTSDSNMIPIVYKITPEDGDKDVSIFEYRKMMATFYVPINKDIVIPHNEFGKTVNKTLKIYIDKLSVEDKTNNILYGINDISQTWSSDLKAVTLNTNNIFLAEANHTLKLTMKALEKKNGTYQDYRVGFAGLGPVWPGEDHTHKFTTGKVPYPIADSEIKSTIPIRRQRYFMQQEMNDLYKNVIAPVITFRGDMKAQGKSDYFPASDDKNKYTYYLRWQDLSGGEPVEQIKNLGTVSSVPFIASKIPDLLPATIYSCQLIRKTDRIFTVTMPDGQTMQLPQSEMSLQIKGETISSLAAGADANLNLTDTLTAAIQLDPGQVAGPGEDIIYQFYFRTSKYPTLADKIANVSTSFENIETDLTHYPKVIFTMDERFDEFDVLGYFDSESPFQRLMAPRVHIGAILNRNPVYTYSYNPPEIYTQTPYSSSNLGIGNQTVFLGQSSYNHFLNHSLIGFVNLYQELASQSHSVQAHRVSGTRPTPIQLNNQLLPAINSTISKDYTQDVIDFSFGNQEIQGYLGPLTDQNIQNTWAASQNNFQINPQSGGGFGSTGSMGGIEISLPNSSFSVTYKMPYWVHLDIDKAISSGDYVFSRTTVQGTIEIPPLGGGNGGIIGTEGEIGTGTTPQIMGSGGPDGEGISLYNPKAYEPSQNHTTTNTGDLTTYNIWTHYLDTYYPAFRIQLDNMNLNKKKMQLHQGTYSMIIKPDRGWLPANVPSEAGKRVLSFSYNPLLGSLSSGTKSSESSGIILLDGGTMGKGSTATGGNTSGGQSGGGSSGWNGVNFIQEQSNNFSTPILKTRS